MNDVDYGVFAEPPKPKLMAKPISKVMRYHVMGGLAMANGWTKGAELGVHTGIFTTFLCHHNPQLHMIAVDLWAPQPELKGDGTYTYLQPEWNHEHNYNAFVEACTLHFPTRVTIRRMKTTDAAKEVENGSLDFVFVDADHGYEGCKQDIVDWAPKVRSGGVVAGHDLDWPTVKRAVDEQFGAYGVFSDNVWVWTKP